MQAGGRHASRFPEILHTFLSLIYVLDVFEILVIIWYHALGGRAPGGGVSEAIAELDGIVPLGLHIQRPKGIARFI